MNLGKNNGKDRGRHTYYSFMSKARINEADCATGCAREGGLGGEIEETSGIRKQNSKNRDVEEIIFGARGTEDEVESKGMKETRPYGKRKPMRELKSQKAEKKKKTKEWEKSGDSQGSECSDGGRGGVGDGCDKSRTRGEEK